MDFALGTFPVWLALLIAVLLVMLGVIFTISPKIGFSVTQHRAENLPAIIGGRYFFMALLIAGFAMTGRQTELAFVFFGLAGVASFDAVVYAIAKSNVVPHILAAIGATLAGFWVIEGAPA